VADDSGRIVARYSNHLEVGQNAFEFLLEFGQSYSVREQETTIHTRIVTSPYFAKHFSDLLQESVRRYEEQNGMIPSVEP
jgi:hypothetical protein